MNIKTSLLKRFSQLILIAICAIGCEEILYETDISNNQVSLLAPADGAALNFTSVNFNWDRLEDASEYRLQIATPNFENANQIVTDVVLGSVTEFNIQLNINEYQWRVKALNSEFETQYSTASFSVLSSDNFEENTVNLTSPEDGLVTNMGDFTLMWDAIEGATSYRVEIEDDNANIVEGTEVTSNNYPYVFDEGSFTWRVRAEKDEQTTLYSSRTILIDMTNPNTPLLQTPEDGSILDSESVDFTWNRELLEGSAEFDSLYIFRDEQLLDLVEKDRVIGTYNTTLENNVYYWLMKAFDEAGNQSEASSTFTFTVNQ